MVSSDLQDIHRDGSGMENVVQTRSQSVARVLAGDTEHEDL